MVIVTKSKGESADVMWRKFGKINFEENLVDELRSRKYYKKPSLVRKEEEKIRKKLKGRKPRALSMLKKPFVKR